jgi:hypothetical protein
VAYHYVQFDGLLILQVDVMAELEVLLMLQVYVSMKIMSQQRLQKRKSAEATESTRVIGARRRYI